jgi:membrane associated rhomboid family serine protease
MMCGTPVAPQQPRAATRERAQADPETVRFVRAVVSRPATFTFIFLVANVFLYLLMWLSGGATGQILLAYGAKLNYLIDYESQWWRFVTPIFLHVHLPGLGPLHLLSNMYGLFMLGPYVEKLYGSARFVVFWILTGVAGVAASYLTVRPGSADGALGQYLFKQYDSPSAGASGALFGLMGVLFVFGIKYRHELPEGLKRAFGTGLLPTLLVNLFIGYVARGFIDNAAHLGGLVSGMALALVVGYKRPGARGAVAHAWHAAQAACLLLVAASFVMVVRHFDAPPPRLSNLPDRARAFGEKPPVVPFIESVNAGRNALARFLGEGEAEALAPAFEKLEKTPSLSPDADIVREDLKALVARARTESGDRNLKEGELARQRERLGADFLEWDRRFDRWVEEEGRPTFGINIQKAEPPRGGGPEGGDK